MPKQIRQMINWRRHKPHSRLKRRLPRRTRMRPRRHKHLRSTEGRGQALAFFFGQRGLELGEVGAFLFVDVLGEILHQGLEGGEEGGVGGFEVLEFFEFFFYLLLLLTLDYIYFLNMEGGEGLLSDAPSDPYPQAQLHHEHVSQTPGKQPTPHQ